MDEPNPFDDDANANPFGDMADGLNQIFQLFGGAGGPGSPGAGPSWQNAKQAAAALASDGSPEANVDPMVRMQYEQLARVAELQVGEITGLTISRSGQGVDLRAVTRAEWASATIDDYRPVFEKLAESLGRVMGGQLEDVSPDELEEMSEMLPPGMGIDMASIMNAMSSFMGPMMLVAMAGSTVGQLANRAFGSYDLPVPRPPSDELLVVSSAVDEFGESWSLPIDDLRLYTCMCEVAHHAVLGIPHVHERLTHLLSQHADGFEADPEGLQDAIGPIDPEDPAAFAELQNRLGNPEVMLSAMRSDRQRELLPLIDTLVACIEGYVDWVLDSIGGRLLSDYPMVSEAFRRRRVETSDASRFIEKLFGLELTQSKIDSGAMFIDGIVERADRPALDALWSDVDHLPTANELAAPGLWLARVGLAEDQPLPELDEDPDIPDFPDLDK